MVPTARRMSPTDPRWLLGEVQLWRQILMDATAMYGELPVAVRERIERTASHDEVLNLVPDLARYSTLTRQRFQTTADGLLLILDNAAAVTQLEAYPPQARQRLRSVRGS